ncbi:hypothetical protein IscW_ISCW011265 [Ixodes scapularis]|uniref:Uncharacterized protein n=1 Tax=Ixodes scapularis TaxID=6945 RepID=B7Q8F3_IXOSC|nr:hypothetical protein IscW_ISCW011265 [Ixodes scapularis]|eukprot:XP_002412351.1 hypothetical protein IscW_ISCW011265 [Ixodes scapularis]
MLISLKKLARDGCCGQFASGVRLESFVGVLTNCASHAAVPRAVSRRCCRRCGQLPGSSWR